MTRTDLEARLVAHAIVQPGRRQELLDQVDRDCISPACWALLSQLAEPDDAVVWCRTVQQRRLADLAEAITVAQLLDSPSAGIVAELNRGEHRRTRTHAWERDLAAGLARGGAAA